jgi:chorismate mutase-like protein
MSSSRRAAGEASTGEATAGEATAGEASTGEATAGEVSAADGLQPFRRRLDRLDGEIAERLGERFEVCREIALYKREHDIPMMQPDRVAQVRARYLARGREVRLPPDFTADLFELLIAATCRMEDELIAAEGPAETP